MHFSRLNNWFSSCISQCTNSSIDEYRLLENHCHSLWRTHSDKLLMDMYPLLDEIVRKSAKQIMWVSIKHTWLRSSFLSFIDLWYIWSLLCQVIALTRLTQCRFILILSIETHTNIFHRNIVGVWRVIKLFAHNEIHC